ncbi:hypothetical protein OSB04_un000614 [Centaurea solstitialis]|uniref:Uncharacterized protein n=1 Tax=Centaurea solstitialis TaxID=347529 RepID=A0AA38S4Q7_9ASTR|nr:hypothetical protein OSB04_un000614 [Centaurea solstitialis]
MGRSGEDEHDDLFSSIFDPRDKVEYMPHQLKQLYGEDVGKAIFNKVKSMLTSLFEDYVAQYSTSDSEPPQTQSQSQPQTQPEKKKKKQIPHSNNKKNEEKGEKTTGGFPVAGCRSPTAKHGPVRSDLQHNGSVTPQGKAATGRKTKKKTHIHSHRMDLRSGRDITGFRSTVPVRLSGHSPVTKKSTTPVHTHSFRFGGGSRVEGGSVRRSGRRGKAPVPVAGDDNRSGQDTSSRLGFPGLNKRSGQGGFGDRSKPMVPVRSTWGYKQTTQIEHQIRSS